ncbi:MAG: hypothetical protein ACOYIR_03800 [Christensenellales bacterium]|jgi:hypothetical protein
MIDINALFKATILEKLRAGEDPAQIEEDMPDLFLQWLDTPNAATGGVSPNEYFYSMDTAQLADALCDYVSAGKNPPDPLLNALEDASDSEEPLFELLCGKRGSFSQMEQSLKAKRVAAELLNQKGSALPVQEYLEIVKNPTQDEGLNEAAAMGLSAMGEAVQEQLLAALKGASDEAADCLLDLLSALPKKDKRVFDYLIGHFRAREERRAFFAGLLARYGDPKALPVLEQALPFAGYVDYCALRDAIESLGGTVSEQRDFSGDPDYEKLKQKR